MGPACYGSLRQLLAFDLEASNRPKKLCKEVFDHVDLLLIYCWYQRLANVLTFKKNENTFHSSFMTREAVLWSHSGHTGGSVQSFCRCLDVNNVNTRHQTSQDWNYHRPFSKQHQQRECQPSGTKWRQAPAIANTYKQNIMYRCVQYFRDHSHI